MAHLVVISDLHLGQSFNLGAFKDFLADLRKRTRPDMLILAGDILELAWLQWEDLKAQKLAMDALDELRTFAVGIETSYLCGNHDPYQAIPKDEVAPIHVVAPPVDGPASLERDGVVYSHGHQFDRTTKVWDGLLRLPVKAFLPSLYSRLYGTPYQIKVTHRQDAYNELIGFITGQAITFSQRQGKDLCFGHTHFPILLDLGGRVIAGDGDWRDSNSFIEARDGKMTLKFWRP